MGNNKRVWGFLLGLGLTTAQAGVIVEELPTLPVGGVGVKTELTSEIWGKNPKVSDMKAQLQAVAEADLNATERAILRQVVLTEITQGISSEEEGLALLKERLNVLMVQGLFEDVLTLTDRIPVAQQNADVQRYRAEALFALGRVSEACSEELLVACDDEAFMRAVCAGVTKGPDEAALAFEVYRENGSKTHPFFDAAGDVMYRLLPAKLPKGHPTVWEWPLTARAFGEDVYPLVRYPRDVRMLALQPQVPHEVKSWAEQRLAQSNHTEQMPDGQILKHLKAWAKARKDLEKSLPSTYQNWGHDGGSAH